MKTNETRAKPAPTSAAARKLIPKISEASREAESARHRAQAAKAEFKLARKDFKHAKKAAKVARKELKALKELLERASQPAPTQPKAKAKRAAATRKPAKPAPLHSRKKKASSAAPPPEENVSAPAQITPPPASLPTPDLPSSSEPSPA